MYNTHMLNRHYYTQLGFKTIPITFGQKLYPPTNWQHTDSETMWSTAPANSNTALQAGVSNMFLLDPDTENGEVHVQNYMDGLGIDTWKVITWRGYTHHWLKTTMPHNTQWNGKLIDGMGDWRGKNGYGLAAPSFVRTQDGEGFYSIPESNPTEVPFINWTDLVPLLRINQKTALDPKRLTLPVPVLKRKLPHWAYLAAKQVAEMEITGDVIVGSRHWESRSEAVMSMLMSSILNGHDYRLVMKMCGEYKTDQWWTRSVAKAIQYLSTEGERPLLEKMYHSSFDLDTKDEDVFRAMLSILWYVGDTAGHISNRDIQLLVARGRYSVSSSVSRLINNKYVTLLETSDGNKASKYKVNTHVSMETREKTLVDSIHQEVLRHGALSHNQVAILDALTENKTPKQLSDETDLGLSGVYYALNKLERYDLVEKSGKRWGRTAISPDALNALFDAQDSFSKRKHRIAQERSLFSNRG